MVEYRDEDRRDGYERLRRLLPAALVEAERMAQDAEFQIGVMSGTARALAEYVHSANLDGVIVYRGPKGGWHCDVLLKSTPPGIPDALGTPADSPFEAKFQAEEHAPHLLAGVLAMGLRRGEGQIEGGPPCFVLHDTEVLLWPELVADAVRLREEQRARNGETFGRDILVRMLRKMLAGLGLEHGCTPEDLDRLSPDERRFLMALLAGAAGAGINRWPLPVDRPPTEDAAARWSES